MKSLNLQIVDKFIEEISFLLHCVEFIVQLRSLHPTDSFAHKLVGLAKFQNDETKKNCERNKSSKKQKQHGPY